jgi:hypothetical protein
MSPRVLSVVSGLLWLLAALLGPENSSVLAQKPTTNRPTNNPPNEIQPKRRRLLPSLPKRSTYSMGRLAIRNAFGWVGEWLVCSGAAHLINCAEA